MISPVTLFIITGTILFCIPGMVQLPFRVMCLILFNIYVFYRHKSISLQNVSIGVIIVLFICFKLKRNTFDTSLLMIALSIFPVYYFYKFKIRFSKKVLHSLYIASSIWIIGIVIQMSIFRYNGRPTLGYEINQSGSYLFLIYLLSDILKYRYKKIIIVILSCLLLSRLLLGCIIVFELIKLVKPKISFIVNRFTYTNLIILSAIAISIFSLWYFINMSGNITDGSDGIDRLSNLNDGSNYLRFKINSEILINLLTNEDIRLLQDGYGDLGKNSEYRNIYYLMPHNELYKAIAQFGIFFTLICFLISRKSYTKLVNKYTIIYFIPVCIYTLILWVRFTIIPSIEMLFILYILLFANEKNRHCNIRC